MADRYVFLISYIHQNGSLLRKCTYLSNDSSYSVSYEDGVEITLFDRYSSDDDDKKSLEHTRESSETAKIFSLSQDNPDPVPSFTFETQVLASLTRFSFRHNSL